MHNEFRPNWSIVVYILALLAALSWLLVFCLQGVDSTTLLSSFSRIGIVTLVVSMSWRIITRHAWRWIPLRWFLKIPDLEGRWEGTYKSSAQDYKEEFRTALELKQTLLNISGCAYGYGRSKAEIRTASLLSDPSNTEFQLGYLYHAKRPPEAAKPGDEHEGMALLQLIRVKGEKPRLEGIYLNDRHDPETGKRRPTLGTWKLVWVSKELKGEL